MLGTRNALISFGVFWLSLWVAWILQLPSSDRLINAVVRDETVLSALAMGVSTCYGDRRQPKVWTLGTSRGRAVRG